MSDVHSRLTGRARKVIQLAELVATRWGHRYVGPEHLLVGILDERRNVAAHVLGTLGVSPEEVVAATMQVCGVGSPGETELAAPSARGATVLAVVRPEHQLTANESRLLLAALSYANANEDDLRDAFLQGRPGATVDGLPLSIPGFVFQALIEKCGLDRLK